MSDPIGYVVSFPLPRRGAGAIHFLSHELALAWAQGYNSSALRRRNDERKAQYNEMMRLWRIGEHPMPSSFAPLNEPDSHTEQAVVKPVVWNDAVTE